MIMYETTLVYTVLIVLGLCLGSFAGATVWRLRARQLRDDKKHHEHVNEKEYDELKKLTKASLMNDRSQCLHCSYTLKWYDLIPVLSWVTLGGKCRNCRKPIGYMEPLIELGVAAYFVVSYVFWPVELASVLAIAQFVVWLAVGVCFAILFAYDKKWFLLPDEVNFTLIVLGAVSAILIVLQAPDLFAALLSLAGSVAVLCGLYLVLYQVSKGRWIGFGDVKLGLALGLLLADWRFAFLALFAANLLGCLVVLGPLLQGKLKRNTRVPFGPLLILGAIIAQLAGLFLVDQYMYFLI